MLSEYLTNEIAMSCDYIRSHQLMPKSGTVINIIGKHMLCDCIKDVLSQLGKNEYKYTVYRTDSSDALSSTVCKQCFLYCLDARNTDTLSLIDLSNALSYASKIKGSQFIAMVIIPPLRRRYGVMSLSEMEVCATCSDYLNEIEDTLRSYEKKLNVKEIRFDNFIGESSSNNLFDLNGITDAALSTGVVSIDRSDAFDVVSAISLSDAVDAVFTVLKNGKDKNIYNASSLAMSVYDLKSFIYQSLCKYGIDAEISGDTAKTDKSYRVLNCGKLCSVGFENVCDNEHALLYALSDILPPKYDIIKDKINAIYDGKLDEIKRTELELLKVVDRICRENNIKYFLSGGTMLGAVRHKGFIPWDDDIDIAMLRDDFEKFRALCKEQLPEKYRYQTFENKDGYHYFFDKITVNNTYFATKYSDEFDMQKGISMDIFIFDKTAKSKFMQKLHFKTLMAFRLMMNVRWINRPRKGKSYMLSKLLLPLLRLFSMDTYSKIYDKLLRRYENSNSPFVLPPATDHTARGVMPLEWFSDVTDAEFDGVTSYIPIGYDDYLKIWYGKDYMDVLPLYKRVGSHNFYRLDLGYEICRDKVDKSKHIKNFNSKGELL